MLAALTFMVIVFGARYTRNLLMALSEFRVHTIRFVPRHSNSLSHTKVLVDCHRGCLCHIDIIVVIVVNVDLSSESSIVVTLLESNRELARGFSSGDEIMQVN